MKRTKFVSALAALPLAAVLLAGCGGGGDEETPSPSATSQAPEIQGHGVNSPSDGGGETSPTTSPSDAGGDGPITINDGSETPAPSASPTAPSTDTPPSNLGENTGAESNYGGTNNPKCEGVASPVPKGTDGYTEERDADKDGIACEPNDGGIGAPSATPAPTDDGDDTTAPGSTTPEPSLGIADGTTIWAVTTKETKIYSSTDTGSQAIGTAENGASFKGTVTADGKWVKIDRSAGYIPASAVKVDRQL